MVLSEVDTNYYNQIKENMIGSFQNNELKQIKVMGNGETIIFS